MKIAYISKKFGPDVLKTIATVNQIIESYRKQGYDLTLRQLYYQFVARDLIPNKQAEYKRLGDIVNNGRLAGLISWHAIVDRTRNLQKNSHWNGPHEIVEACAKQFKIDKWATQETRLEVWIEKDALAGVIEGVCRRNDVSYFSCRGYTSQSEMWSASQRLIEFHQAGQTPKIIHLGDHDPSGKDMTRDITDRLTLFCGFDVEVNRIALNMDQVTKYRCPPNPAKLTDSRATDYIAEFGDQSWELDALEPSVIDKLIDKTIRAERDDDKWEAAIEEENEHKQALRDAAEELENI